MIQLSSMRMRLRDIDWLPDYSLEKARAEIRAGAQKTLLSYAEPGSGRGGGACPTSCPPSVVRATCKLLPAIPSLRPDGAFLI